MLNIFVVFLFQASMRVQLYYLHENTKRRKLEERCLVTYFTRKYTTLYLHAYLNFIKTILSRV